MRLTAIVLLTLLCSVSSLAQKLVATDKFEVGTPFIEPDGRKETVKIGDGEFVTLAKSKGNQMGPSDYVLGKYDQELQEKFAVELVAGPDEDYLTLFYNGTDIVLLSVLHDYFKNTSNLIAYGFDPSSGEKKFEKTLREFEVGKWADVRYKGAVKEDFTNCINSSLKPGFVTPVEFQYQVRFSPDREKVLVYIFDYSKKELEAKVRVFDKNLNPLQEGSVLIDHNLINHGIHINNRGDLYILNVDKLGRIVLVQHNLEENKTKLLDLQYSSTQRESLTLRIHNDDEVFITNTSTRDGTLVGIMYTKFNFADNLVEKIHYHEIGTGLKQTITTSREADESVPNKEDWKGYYITDFYVDENEELLIVAEKRQLIATGYECNGNTVNHVDRWKERRGEIHAEGMLLFKFKADNSLDWETYYLKSQKNEIVQGLNSASYSMDKTRDGKLRMIYAASSSGLGGGFNLTNYVEWDLSSGKKLKDISLHSEGEDYLDLGLLRNYTVWWPQKVFLVGKKGLFGKKTFMNMYSLNMSSN